VRPLGSSSAPGALGLSPYATPADVQARLLGAPGRAAGWAALLGNELEPLLRRLAGEALGAELTPGPPYGAAPWPVAEHQISHPDAHYPAEGGLRLVELKLVTDWDGWGADWPRPDYRIQVAHQLEARHPGGLELVAAVLYAVHRDTGESRLYHLPRTAAGPRLVQRLGDWYDAHVVHARPVPPVARPTYLPAAKGPRHYVETLEARDLVAALRDAQSAMDAAEARVAAARAAVLALVGDADGVTVGGRPVATHHAQSARRVSADRVRDLADQRPDLAPLLDRCFTESTSRVLRLPQE
jgi:hypothetical protein